MHPHLQTQSVSLPLFVAQLTSLLLLTQPAACLICCALALFPPYLFAVELMCVVAVMNLQHFAL